MIEVRTRFKAEPVNGDRHFARLRRSGCCVPGCDSFQSIVHHERRGTGGGTALKPPPRSGIPLCNAHHQEGHQVGWISFERKYRVDLRRIAQGHAMVSEGMGLLAKEELPQ